MRVYVETNFLLELTFDQEQQDACAELMTLSSGPDVELIVPVFSLAESSYALRGRYAERKKLIVEVDNLRRQTGRTRGYASYGRSIGAVRSVLIKSQQEDLDRYFQAASSLLAAARIIPVTANVIKAASALARDHELLVQHAIVYASILDDLGSSSSLSSCFITSDHHFDKPTIVAELASKKCKLFSNFSGALAHVQHEVRKA